MIILESPAPCPGVPTMHLGLTRCELAMAVALALASAALQAPLAHGVYHGSETFPEAR